MRKLLPIIPEVDAAENWYSAFDPSYAGSIAYLRKFRDYFDECVVIEMNRELIKRVQGETGLRVIPNFHLADFIESEDVIPPFSLDPERAAYAQWLETHQEKFRRVLVCNRVYESFTTLTSQIPGLMRALCDLLPWVGNRVGLCIYNTHLVACMKEPVASQAIADLFEKFTPMLLLYVGHWRTKGDLTEQVQKFIKAHPEAEFYTGIQFAQGARDHNLRYFMEFGFDGCLFFVPPVVSPEADRAMEDYLIDVAPMD